MSRSFFRYRQGKFKKQRRRIRSTVFLFTLVPGVAVPEYNPDDEEEEGNAEHEDGGHGDGDAVGPGDPLYAHSHQLHCAVHKNKGYHQDCGS